MIYYTENLNRARMLKGKHEHVFRLNKVCRLQFKKSNFNLLNTSPAVFTSAFSAVFVLLVAFLELLSSKILAISRSSSDLES